MFSRGTWTITGYRGRTTRRTPAGALSATDGWNIPTTGMTQNGGAWALWSLGRTGVGGWGKATGNAGTGENMKEGDSGELYVNEEAYDYHDRARDALHDALHEIDEDALTSISLLFTTKGSEGMHQFNWGDPNILTKALYTALNSLLSTLEDLSVGDEEAN